MNIVVVGSLNMDVVIQVPRYPKPGETVTGGSVSYIPGGKGANQSLAAARLGARVTHIGMLGLDPYAERLRQTLTREGVDTTYIRTWEGPTGMAFVHVEADGTNRIIVSPGANGQLQPLILDALQPVFADADAVMVQLEIPIESVRRVVELARSAHVPVFLDPAPARADLFEYVGEVDWIMPNEFEAELLTGQTVSDAKTAHIAAAKLQQRGARRVVLKAGSAGAYLLDEHGFDHHPAFRVQPVDTTAAGDAFGAAFVVDYLHAKDAHHALRIACAAGALATTKVGAYTSLPHRDELETFLKQAPAS